MTSCWQPVLTGSAIRITPQGRSDPIFKGPPNDFATTFHVATTHWSRAVIRHFHKAKNAGHYFMKKQTSSPLQLQKFNRALLGGILVLGLGACASTPAPDQALQAAELAITNAE